LGGVRQSKPGVDGEYVAARTNAFSITLPVTPRRQSCAASIRSGRRTVPIGPDPDLLVCQQRVVERRLYVLYGLEAKLFSNGEFRQGNRTTNGNFDSINQIGICGNSRRRF
jgi:hypothetical protein